MIVVGLMSGTSADGVDVAICDIRGKPGEMTVELLHGSTYEYESDMRQRILSCCDASESRVDQIAALHTDLAEVFAQCTLVLIEQAGMTPHQVDLVGSHGQTLWHNVLGQRRCERLIADCRSGCNCRGGAGITVISNFRARDIAAGGQGAPLTSYIDWLLLRHPTKWRAVQNIGGMGNVTFLPPLDNMTAEPIAFDTGPGNALLDIAVSALTGGAQNYDRDGEYAKRGRS